MRFERERAHAASLYARLAALAPLSAILLVAAVLRTLLTPPDLQRLVETGQLRFVMIGDTRRWTRRYASQQAIDDWGRTYGKPVDPALWRAEAEPAREASSVYSAARRDPPELYDLRG